MDNGDGNSSYDAETARDGGSEEFPPLHWIVDVGAAMYEAGKNLVGLAPRLRAAADDRERWRILAGQLGAIEELGALVLDLHACLRDTAPDPGRPR